MSAKLRNILNRMARRIWGFVTSVELLIYVCFVALATLMWFGHAMSSIRNANIPVHIAYTGVPQDMAFSPELPKTINIEVRDAGNRLRVYTSSPLELTFDLSRQIKGTDGEVYVSEESIRRSITNVLQGTSKLQHVTPSQIHATYHKQEDKLVSIRSQVSLNSAPEYHIICEPQLTPSTVHVYGFRKALDAIDTIYTEKISLNNLRDTIDTLVHLITPQGVRLQSDSVRLHAVAERFTEKTFVLPIIPRNIPDGYRLHLFPLETTVTIRCAMSHFADINENDIHIECDYPADDTQQLDLEAHCDNPYVTNIKLSPAKVEFIIEK